MKFCMSCGTQLQPEWQFCANCRQPVENGEQQGRGESVAAEPGMPAGNVFHSPGSAARPGSDPQYSATPIVETADTHHGSLPTPHNGGLGGDGGDGSPGAPGAEGAASGGPAAPGKKTSRKSIILASLAVVVIVLGVGAFLFVQNMLRGGAGSPEQAAEKLIESLETRDVLSLVTMVAPAERDALDRLRIGMTEKAEEFEILESANKVSEARTETDTEISLDGITVTFEDAEPEITEVDDQLAVLNFTSGTVRVQVDPAQTTGVFRTVLDAAGATDAVDETTELADMGTDGGGLLLAAVKDDGRWYISPLYTGLESITLASGAERGTLPEAAEGSDSPAQAAEALVGALPGILESGRFTDVGNHLAEHEGNAVHYYGGALNDGMEGSTNPEFELLSNTFADAGQDGGRGRATVDSLELSMNGSSIRVSANCIQFEGSSESCSNGSGYLMPGSPAASGGILQALPPLGLSSVKEDGAWKVSLLDTAADWALAWMDSLTRDQALAMMDLAHAEDPAGTMTLGQETDVEFNSAGYAVMRLDVDKSTLLDITGSYSSFTVYSSDGTDEITSSEDYLPEDTPAGEYKVVIFAGEEWSEKFAETTDGSTVEYSQSMTFDELVPPALIDGSPEAGFGYLSTEGISDEAHTLEVPAGNNVELLLTVQGYDEWNEPGVLLVLADGKSHKIPVSNDLEELVIPYPEGEEDYLFLELMPGGSGSEVDYTLEFVPRT